MRAILSRPQCVQLEQNTNIFVVTELDDKTRKLHEEQVVQSRMVTTFTDVVFYVLYLCLLIGISDEVGGQRSFLQTDNVKQFLPVELVITPSTLRTRVRSKP